MTVVKVDALASFTYNGETLADSYDIYLDKGQTFNLRSIIASYNGTQLGVCGDSYVKASGDTTFTAVGEHTFTVTYNAKGDAIVGTDLEGKVIAGSKTVTVRVWDGQIDADKQLYVYGPGYSTPAPSRPPSPPTTRRMTARSSRPTASSSPTRPVTSPTPAARPSSPPPSTTPRATRSTPPSRPASTPSR